jgi:aspartyl protease family protein
MADDPRSDRPWGSPRPFISGAQLRFLVWIALVAAGVLAIRELMRLFPRTRSDYDTAYVIQWVAYLALMSSIVLRFRRAHASQLIRHASIWVGIGAVLLLGYTYQDELGQVALRVRSELVPTYAVASDARTLVLTQDNSGAFSAMGEVNGIPVSFLVDTGASDVVLSPSDARRLGADLSSLQFAREFETANGVGHGAPYRVARLGVGPIALFDVPVTINESEMSSSLLGMAFLKRLDSFEVRGRKLYLHWRK